MTRWIYNVRVDNVALSGQASGAMPAPPQALRMKRWGPAALLGAILAAGAGLRVWVALHDDGVFWPDEVHQSLEPAHRWLFGYGLIAWEFAAGARNWTLAGAVAGVIKVAVALFGNEPRGYLLAVRLFFAAIGVATAWAAYHLSRRLGASPLSATAAACLFSLANFALLLSTRALSETASALPLTLALAALVPKTATRRQVLLGGALLSLAVLLRLQSGFYCAGALVLLLAQGRRRSAFELLCVLLVGAFAFGLIDRLTWGHWFHSAAEYVRFNVVEGKSGNFGRQPLLYYARVGWTAFGPLALLWVALGAAGARRAGGGFALPCAFVLIHSLILHKELRFLFPTLPLFAAVAGVGLDRLKGRAHALALAVVGATSLISAVGLGALSYEDLGLLRPEPDSRLAMDDGGPENRLLLRAHDLPDLCGLKVATRPLDITGAYSYLHRNVPLFDPDGAPDENGTYNYAIVHPSASDLVVVEDHQVALIRLSVAECKPSATFSFRLR